jgi:uncharacterized protein (TIRG00374 family)
VSAGPPAPGPPAPGAAPDADESELYAHLAELDGLGSVRAAAELLEETQPKSKLRRFIEFGVSIAITVFIFVRLIPKFFNVEYHDVWGLLTDINRSLLGFIVVFWLFTMWNYAGALAASLPGLKRMQAAVTNFSGSALANVVPFGGAAGVGATYAQSLSWGFDIPSITLSTLVTGVWNVFAKLGMPIIVLGLLFATGHPARGLGAAAVIGFAILVASIALFVLALRSARLALALGRFAERLHNDLRRLVRRPPKTGLAGHVVEFREQTVGLIRDRWRRITLWMVLYKISQGVLQLLCARAVGVEAGWIEIFAVYTFGELLSTIPLTPSGVGFVEAGSAGLLVSFGATNQAALAAVLLYRAFTYLFEIPLGAVGWLTWATRHSWRKPPGSMSAALSAAAAASAAAVAGPVVALDKEA